jgi:hypothetical protein
MAFVCALSVCVCLGAEVRVFLHVHTLSHTHTRARFHRCWRLVMKKCCRCKNRLARSLRLSSRCSRYVSVCLRARRINLAFSIE